MVRLPYMDMSDGGVRAFRKSSSTTLIGARVRVTVRVTVRVSRVGASIHNVGHMTIYGYNTWPYGHIWVYPII